MVCQQIRSLIRMTGIDDRPAVPLTATERASGQLQFPTIGWLATRATRIAAAALSQLDGTRVTGDAQRASRGASGASDARWGSCEQTIRSGRSCSAGHGWMPRPILIAT